MIYDYTSATEYLKNEFAVRVRKNSRYSLRSFAQYLNVHPAELSQVFNGKRSLSLPSAKKVSRALSLSADESKHLILLLQQERGKTLGLDLDFKEDEVQPNLPEDKFSQVSQWYHFAIFNLIETENFSWSSRHIAKRLGISVSEASTAMSDLEYLGLGKAAIALMGMKKSPMAFVAPKIPSESIRKYHSQMLERARLALEEVHVDRREFQSVGIVTDVAELKAIKKDIDDFTNKLIRKYHKPKKQDVMQIQVCLFPLTKGENR